jgi:hypothetical protein
MIYAYQKLIDSLRTVEMILPEGEDQQRLGTELATIDGTTYVYLPDDAILPTQPTEISVSAITLTPDLAGQIKATSPHVRLINQRVVDKIRLQYSMDEEIKMLRLAPSDESNAYNDYVEQCRDWGRQEKAKLGLI